MKKVKLSEKIRRKEQSEGSTLYSDGSGNYFTMTKVSKRGYRLNQQ